MTLRLTWGTGIGLAYVAFATATTGFVVFAIGREFYLERSLVTR